MISAPVSSIVEAPVVNETIEPKEVTPNVPKEVPAKESVINNKVVVFAILGIIILAGVIIGISISVKNHSRRR
jgi:hypothetical protein